MKRALAGLLAAGLVVLAGHHNNGRGHRGVDPTATISAEAEADATFSLSAPRLPTALTAGGAKVLSVGIRRGKGFDQDVTLSFAGLPRGVIISPASPLIRHGDPCAEVTLKAGDVLPLGDFTVQVTGHPARGAGASSDFLISVDCK